MASRKVKALVVAGVVLILAAASMKVIEEMPFQQESARRLDQSRKWALAFILFATAHGDQLPNDLAQAKTFVSKFGIPGPLLESNWEIVSGGNLNQAGHAAQTILLREKEPRQSPDGRFVKAYAFADGHAELISSPENDFAALEKQRGLLVQSAKK
jgi:hypothetical protein